MTHASPDCVLDGCTPVHADKCVPTPPRAGCIDQWWVHYNVVVALAGWTEVPRLECTTDLPGAVVVTGPLACAVHAQHPHDAFACPEYAVKVVARAPASGYTAKRIVPLGTCA